MQRASEATQMENIMSGVSKQDLSDLQFQVVTDPDVYIQADICIVGAGIAGCGLAWCLGNKGMKVTLIERDFSEPDKFIGELLQPGGVAKLCEIGLHDALEGFEAQQVTGYALFNRAQSFKVEYPKVNGAQTQGKGFRYGKFVTSLRQKVAGLEMVTLIEGSGQSLMESGSRNEVMGVKYKSKAGLDCVIRAPLSVLCDGAFSRFRGGLSESEHEIKSFMVGLLLEDCSLPYEGHGHVFLTEESPCLAYPVSDGKVRMLVDFPGRKSPKTSGRLAERLDSVRKALPDTMKPSFEKAVEDVKIKAMPSQLLAARPSHGLGVVMLGDSLNMRHPLTGGGMTVALSDVQLLSSLLSQDDLNEPQSLRNVIAAFYNLRHKSDASINILADALYDVMKYPDLKDACFAYLNQGPGFTEGPITILSAVSRDTNLLLRKFTDVAVYAARRNMRPFKGLRSIKDSHKVLREAAQIVRPLIMNEKPSWSMRMAVGLSYLVFPK